MKRSAQLTLRQSRYLSSSLQRLVKSDQSSRGTLLKRTLNQRRRSRAKCRVVC
jgi:hypothetical protein